MASVFPQCSVRKREGEVGTQQTRASRKIRRFIQTYSAVTQWLLKRLASPLPKTLTFFIFCKG